MSPLPASIKIGWCDFRIDEWNPRDAASSNRYGETCRLTKVIRIDVSHGPRQTAVTFLHEILHAIYSVWTMNKEDDEERIVTLSSEGLGTVMRDNPDVFAWILDQLK